MCSYRVAFDLLPRRRRQRHRGSRSAGTRDVRRAWSTERDEVLPREGVRGAVRRGGVDREGEVDADDRGDVDAPDGAEGVASGQELGGLDVELRRGDAPRGVRLAPWGGAGRVSRWWLRVCDAWDDLQRVGNGRGSGAGRSVGPFPPPASVSAQPWLTAMVCTAALLACEKNVAALRATDELLA